MTSFDDFETFDITTAGLRAYFGPENVEMVAATIEMTQFGDEKVLGGKVTNNWVTAFAMVDGRLLKGEMKSVLDAVAIRDPKAIYAEALAAEAAHDGAVDHGAP